MMKVSGAILSLVVIAAALCCQVRASPYPMDSDLGKSKKVIVTFPNLAPLPTKATVRSPKVGPGIPAICCFHFSSRTIPSRLVETYKTTISQCGRKGVVFITKRGLKVCANPEEGWVQHIMKQLDNQKTKTKSREAPDLSS